MINCLIEDMKKLTMGASLVVQWYKNPPCNAGDTGSIPGPGRYHMLRSNEACVLQLLSPPEPQLLKPTCPRARAPHARSHQNEKPLNHIEEQPPAHHNQKSLLAANKIKYTNKNSHTLGAEVCFKKKKLTMKPVNCEKVKEIQQGPDKKPTVFQERLIEAF